MLLLIEAVGPSFGQKKPALLAKRSRLFWPKEAVSFGQKFPVSSCPFGQKDYGLLAERRHDFWPKELVNSLIRPKAIRKLQRYRISGIPGIPGIRGIPGIPGIPGTRVIQKPASLARSRLLSARRAALCALRAQTALNQVVLDSPDPGSVDEPDPST